MSGGIPGTNMTTDGPTKVELLEAKLEAFRDGLCFVLHKSDDKEIRKTVRNTLNYLHPSERGERATAEDLYLDAVLDFKLKMREVVVDEVP